MIIITEMNKIYEHKLLKKKPADLAGNGDVLIHRAIYHIRRFVNLEVIILSIIIYCFFNKIIIDFQDVFDVAKMQYRKSFQAINIVVVDIIAFFSIIDDPQFAVFLWI